MNSEFTLAILAMGESINVNKEFLTDLDSPIGDSDHGINMSRGFNAVNNALRELDSNDLSVILKKVGMTLISTVGGASGPLYGTAFLRAGAAIQGKTNITINDCVSMLAAAIQGIKDRGKAIRGEKTMLDALEPAYDAFIIASNEDKPLIACLEYACDAAQKGVEFTKTIKATKGRASYLGERSIGHQDPGATSSLIMLRAITDYVKTIKSR
jgi:phosphoenolpyruvate---glycerone phosphotransferase subunit DhaL